MVVSRSISFLHLNINPWISDPTPNSSNQDNSHDTSSPKRLQTSSIADRNPPTTPTAPRQTEGAQAARSPNARPSTATSFSPDKSIAKLSPKVFITPLPASEPRSRWSPYHDELSTTGQGSTASKKRKRGAGTDRANTAELSNEQNALADEALLQLQELVDEVLVAEDQIDLSQNDSTLDATNLFILLQSEDTHIYTLAPAVYVKLESSLTRVITFGRLGDVSLESLCRLQAIFEKAMTFAESQDYELERAEDSSQWTQSIEAVNIGLSAARTVARIMTGGREEKELYSEETLQALVRVIQKLSNTVIVPTIESRSNNSTSKIFEIATSHKKLISMLLQDLTKILSLLTDLIHRTEMAETVITALEYFAIKLIFVENAHNERDSVVGIQRFEVLRRFSMDIIAEIFLRYPDQRTYLFDEILISLQKLPVTRQHARQYKLKDGASIQLVSALIMRLIQTSALHSQSIPKEKASESATVPDGQSQNSEVDSHKHEQTSNGSGSDSETAGHKAKSKNKAMRLLAKKASTLSDLAARNAQYVIRYFVQRAMTASKSGDQVSTFLGGFSSLFVHSQLY